MAPQLLAEARFVLARPLWTKQHDRSRARTPAEPTRNALATAQHPGNFNVDLDEVNAWLATHRVK
ncbi:MAG: hypothetical protein AAGF11_55650 [Myxococcota bacterium]